MNRKFITIWLLIVLCAANPIRIEISDYKEMVYNISLEISSKLPLKPEFYLNNDNVMTHNTICPKSLPIYCVEKNTTKKTSRCYAEKYFKSWNDITQQDFILDDGVTDSSEHETVTCKISNNLLDLTKNEFFIMHSLGQYDINKGPHETIKDSFQCILIGHQYESNVEEILYYTPQECNLGFQAKPWLSTAKGIENKTGFQKFDPVAGQINYDFFSCSTTKEGILEAKKWYDNQKPWYQRWSKKVKEWYGKFWVVVIICIVGLCGIIVLCMYYCCCNRHAEQSEETDDHDESSVNDSNTHSVSKSDYVIEISELLSMQSTLTSITEPDKYSVETTNSITSTTDPKQSHLTASLSFSSAIELTNEMQVSKDSHDSESKTKVEESDDMHRLQFKNKTQEPKQKSDSNSESHFSI